MSVLKSSASNSTQDILNIGERALALAKRHGAQQADAMISHATDFEVKVADGAILTLTQATSRGLGLRVFVDGRMGFCTTSDLQQDSLDHAVARAVAMAREAAVDPFNGLPELTPGVSGTDALDVFDQGVVELEADEKIRWAHQIEAAARSVDRRVCKFRDSGVSTSVSRVCLITSDGAARTRSSTGIWLWCNPIAEQDGELQTEIWYDGQTHVIDLESPEVVGKTAGMRAVRMLGAKPVPTQRVPVIFEPMMAAGFLAGMESALNGDMVYKKASFLADKLGQRIAVPGLSLVDDPWLPRGVGSSLFDGEGLATSKKAIVDNGVLTTFLYDTYTAKKAKVAPTASAKRSYDGLPHAGTFNVYAEAGNDDPEEILRNVDRALYVTRGLGRGLNAVSGEYSRGANGLWIEHGEVVHPVQEVTIAGDYLTLLNNIDRIGTDLTMRGTTGAPTIRIAEMMVSGK